MNRAIKQGIAIVLYLCMVGLIGHFSAIESLAGEDYEVSIGSSSWSAKESHSHDISREALENGQSAFVVSSAPDDSFRINLSEKQIEDILAGSTVVVNTENGNQKVKIASERKKPAKSGW